MDAQLEISGRKRQWATPDATKAYVGARGKEILRTSRRKVDLAEIRKQ
jgi:hypothetical protein